jgi:predicted nucleic acid-binding protein
LVAHRYWDACVFLAWLKEEQDKLAQCQAALREAEEGKLIIVTSTLTLAETLYLVKGEMPVSQETRQKVRGFFENEYILLAELDRPTAEIAQDVVWDHDVRHKDAIHVATAVANRERLGIEQLDTFDGPLASLSGKIQSLPIGEPNLPEDLISNAATFSADGSTATAASSSLEGEGTHESSSQAP